MNLKRETYLIVVTMAILILVLFLGLGAFRVAARDRERIAELEEIQATLRLYNLKQQSYPADLLELIEAGIGVKDIPKDPFSPKQEYQYAASEDGKGYILLAVLEDVSNEKLKEDLDGVMNGLNCDDRPSYNYCVGL